MIRPESGLPSTSSACSKGKPLLINQQTCRKFGSGNQTMQYSVTFFQYRRHKCSAVTKLCSYILRKLRSFNSPSTPKLDPLSFVPPHRPLLPSRVQETMETESSLISTQEAETNQVSSLCNPSPPTSTRTHSFFIHPPKTKVHCQY